MADFVATYKGHRLNYEPWSLADGNFGARVTITRAEGDKDVVRLFDLKPVFETREAAGAHAKAWAERWIDENS